MKPAPLLLLLAVAALSPASRGAEQPIALVGATLHPASAPPIERGVLVIRDGKIASIGDAATRPADAAVVDLTGKHVYPGMIAPYTQLGLIEIDAVRATLDYDEAGAINPNAHAHKSFTPDSELIPVTRSNGVLLAVSAPEGGRMPGCSSLMQLAGWTWEDMLVKADVGLHVRWPYARRQTDDHDHDEEDEEEDDRPDYVDRLNLLFDQAEAYHRRRRGADAPVEIDLRLDSLGPVLTGERPLIITANNLAEIEAAVAFCVRRGLKMILLGGYDAPLCAPLLIEHDVPVIVGGTLRVPRRRHDPYDHAYSLPARLKQAGVRFCVAGDRQDLHSNARNLPYHAGMAVGFGLSSEDALRSVTLWPAEILGAADRVGSLDPGKDATLFVADGDPLEITTQVERAWVQGAEIDLADRHKRLYEKYQRRLDQVQGKEQP